jgi:cell wall-associated NlpC family hydrolase
MATEAEQRAAVIAEARTWLHTPWRHQGDIKGQAVDCAMLLVRAFCDTGVLARFDPRPYPRAWFMHHDEERFLGWVVEKFGGAEIPLDSAQPADLLLYRFGRCYAHGALLVAPQLVVHAFVKNNMVLFTETFDPDLATRSPRAFDMWAGRRA